MSETLLSFIYKKFETLEKITHNIQQKKSGLFLFLLTYHSGLRISEGTKFFTQWKQSFSEVKRIEIKNKTKNIWKLIGKKCLRSKDYMFFPPHLSPSQKTNTREKKDKTNKKGFSLEFFK